MAELFERDKSTISRHIKNVFEEGELQETATVANFTTVQTEGSRQVERQIEYFNLDVIISVGYRVKSLRGTQFRQWATKRLNEYIRKGFTMDDERLKKLGDGKNIHHRVIGVKKRLRTTSLRPLCTPRLNLKIYVLTQSAQSYAKFSNKNSVSSVPL